MPIVVLTINRIALPFIIDSGATTSVIAEGHYEGPKEKSEPSMGINGIPTKTFCTKPLFIMHDKDSHTVLTTHVFRIIPGCPVNLLGRDLFDKLGLTLSVKEGGGLAVDSSVLPIEAFDESHIVTLCNLQAYLNKKPELPELPEEVWATGEYDTGLISCTPYRATLKPNSSPVFHKQYPLSKEKIEGIKPMVERFLQDGILEEVISPYNTPVNPVKKPNGTYRFVQDLRAVNDLIVPIAPMVPDIHTLLTNIPHDATHFTVIDLKNAFFSIPVDKETRPIFAFSLDGCKQLTWCRMPQGFVDSPVVYSIVLQSTLRPWHPPPRVP